MSGWWHAASDEPWTWAWQPAPGVWVVLGVLVAAYALAITRVSAPARGSEARLTMWQATRFGLGVLALWVALDWPAGTLAGYLALFHALQYLLVALVAVPLLLWGLPPWLVREGARSGRLRPLRAVLRALARPLPAAALFGIVVVATFTGGAVDALRPSETGSALLALAWSAAALLYWWPVIGPAPELAALRYPQALIYLLLPFVAPKLPGAAFLFSSAPHFEVYETAPRVWSMGPLMDQQLAGLLLWLLGSAAVIAAMGALFARWTHEDRALLRPATLAVPADPRLAAALFAVPHGWRTLQSLFALAEDTLASIQPAPGAAAGPRGLALPAAAVSCAVDESVEPPRVVVELAVSLDPPARAEFTARLDDGYRDLLSRLDAGQREALSARLVLRVAGYGSRVG